METQELLARAIQELAQERYSSPGRTALLLFFCISGAAIVTLLANAILHFIKEKISRASVERDLVVKSLRPVADSASALLAKLNSILVHCETAMVDEINRFETTSSSCNLTLSPSKQQFDINDYPALKSCSFRLIHFLLAVRRFEQRTEDVAEGNLLEDIFFYLREKLPVAMKGNIYHAKERGLRGILTEILSDIADGTEAKDNRRFSMRQFDSLINNGIIDKSQLKSICTFFALDSTKVRRDLANSVFGRDCNHFASLCHVAVLLIDFVQLAQNTPRWEEYRIYYVSVLRSHRKRNGTRQYLYRENRDLNDGGTYYSSYWKSVYDNYSLSERNWVHFELLRLWRITRPCRHLTHWNDKEWFYRKAVKRALTRRGQLFGERHHSHIFRRDKMVVIGPDYEEEFLYDNSPEELHSKILALRNREGYRIER
jgi:hypothetical protein